MGALSIFIFELCVLPKFILFNRVGLLSTFNL